MIDIVPLLIVIGVAAAVGVLFALVGWYGYSRSGLRGVVVTWLGGTAAGAAFLVSGIAAPRGTQNPTEFLTALLVSSVIFGAGALVIILWSFLEQPAGTSEGRSVRTAPRFSLGLAVSVSGAMLLALVLSLFMLILFAQHEL